MYSIVYRFKPITNKGGGFLFLINAVACDEIVKKAIFDLELIGLMQGGKLPA